MTTPDSFVDVSLIDVAGRVSVTSRALERTITAISAARLGVAAGEVRVRLSDDSGLLSVAVSGPVRVPPLAARETGESLPARIRAARSGIRDDVTRIAGAQVGTVALSITRAHLIEERRVR